MQSYTGENIPVIGEICVPVEYEGQKVTLPLLITKGDQPSLLGRDWLQHLKLNWGTIFAIHNMDTEGVFKKHNTVFKEGIGTIKDFKVKIHVKSDTKPIFLKPRTVPFALREAVDKELDRLERLNIISPKDRSEWACPIVVVPKADKSLRLCGDYTVTINRCIQDETYPLPTAEDLFATLSGGKWFTKLDLASAYQQLELDDSAKEYLTINTHRGLYRYNRLSFGVSMAPSVFQHVMDQILQGIPGVCCYLDDILIRSRSKEEHLYLLDKVLTRLEQYGVHVKLSKCEFLKSEVQYLGHPVDNEGLHPTEEKVQAIRNAPPPTDLSTLRSWLGMINYYHKFLPNMSTTLQPLYALLHKDTKI